MAISHNPTHTARIEAAWRANIRRRWGLFKRRVLAALKQTQEQPQPLLVNVDDPFVMSPEQQRIYMAYVQQQIDELLLGTPEAPNWQAQYQLESYQRALTEIRTQLMSQGAAIVPTTSERLAAEGLEVFTATPTIATGPIAQPVHREALEFLYLRSYESLQGWTAQLSRETRNILFNGVLGGENPNTVADEISRRIDVSASRARTIAQTEINQAYSRAAIAEVTRASDEVGEEIKVRWITARDSRVRHRHAEVHGVVMDTDRAQGIKINDGINCRCALAPVVPGTNTAKRQRRFTKEREQLLALERT